MFQCWNAWLSRIETQWKTAKKQGKNPKFRSELDVIILNQLQAWRANNPEIIEDIMSNSSDEAELEDIIKQYVSESEGDSSEDEYETIPQHSHGLLRLLNLIQS